MRAGSRSIGRTIRGRTSGVLLTSSHSHRAHGLFAGLFAPLAHAHQRLAASVLLVSFAVRFRARGAPLVSFEHGRVSTPTEVLLQTHVSILHHDYPALVRETVEDKLQHLAKFYDRIVSVRALLERHHAQHRVELVANVGHGAVLVVDARDDGFADALEAALQRMERLLKRHHDKLSYSRRRSR